MIFVSLNRSQLLKITGICSVVSPRKSETEIFSFLKVSVSDKNVNFLAINNLGSFSSTINKINSEESADEISFLIKTEVFHNAISLVNDQLIGLEIDLNNYILTVQGAKAKHSLRINTEQLLEFIKPEPVEPDIQTSIKVDYKEFSSLLKAALISVGQPKNVYEPKFLNVCLTLRLSQNLMNVVSTDRYRLTKSQLPIEVVQSSENQENSVINYLLLPKSVQLILSSQPEASDFQLDFYEEGLIVRFDSSEFFFRYGEGQYPDYNKIIPQTFACNFVVTTKELVNSLKQVYLSARSNTLNKSVQIEVNPEENTLRLSSASQDGYSSESVVQIQNYQGVLSPWKQSFNADYLLDYLNIVEAEEICWESNPQKPSVLSVKDQKEKQLYLVSGLK